MAGDRLLRYAATLFTVAVLVHNADHLRRGRDSIETDVFVLGSFGIILEIAVVAIVFMRHRLAPLAAVTTGLSLAAGYAFVHFTPGRSWLSDSFPSGDVSAASWVAASFETAAALILAIVGWKELQRRGGLASASAASARVSLLPERSWRDAFTEPVVLAMALGNAVIFVLTFAS